VPSRLRLRPGRNMRNKTPSKHAVKCNLTTQLVKRDHLLRGVISETQPAVFRFESPTAHPHAGRRVVLHSGRRGEGHPQRGGHTEKKNNNKNYVAWWIPTGRPSVEAEALSNIGVAVVSVPADRHVQELVRLGRRSVDAVVLLAAGKAGFLLVAPPLPRPFLGLPAMPCSR